MYIYVFIYRYQATRISGFQTPIAQGRSTTIISKIQWTRTSRLSIKISLSKRSIQVAASSPGPSIQSHSQFVPRIFFKSERFQQNK